VTASISLYNSRGELGIRELRGCTFRWVQLQFVCCHVAHVQAIRDQELGTSATLGSLALFLGLSTYYTICVRCEFYFPCSEGAHGRGQWGWCGSKSNSFELDFHSGTVGYNFIKMIEICACMLVMSEMGLRVIDIVRISCLFQKELYVFRIKVWYFVLQLKYKKIMKA